MDKTCTECGKIFLGKGTKCSACVKRAQRAKDTPVTPETPETPDSSVAILIEELKALGVKTQGDQAWRSIEGKGGYWVTPHRDKFGPCLNPDCRLERI